MGSLPVKKELTDRQRELIHDSAILLRPDGLGIAITRHMYGHMLKDHPDLINIFSHSKQATGKQALALATAVHAYAAHIHDLKPLESVIERIAHKHVSLDIRPEQYLVVAEYLLASIASVLGPDVFTSEVSQAWEAGYWALTWVFVETEAKLYAAAQQQHGSQNGGKGWKGWRSFVLKKRVPESDDVTSFYLAPQSGNSIAGFRPGQYISVQLYIPELGCKQSRQYSLSDAPAACVSGNYYRISVKREPAVKTILTTRDGSRSVDTTIAFHPAHISNRLHDDFELGTVIEVACPFGEFVLRDDPTSIIDAVASTEERPPVVLLSAGVGLTPVLSMLNMLFADGAGGGAVKGASGRQITWIQGMRTPHSHPFRAHILGLASSKLDPAARQEAGFTPHLDVAFFYSQPGTAPIRASEGEYRGRMDVDKLDEKLLHIGDSRTRYYVCGPGQFMQDVKRKLEGKGVDQNRIHDEVFVP